MEAENAPQPRTPLHLEVDFKKSYARQNSKGVLRNISLTGAFLECQANDVRAADKLQLTFIVAGRERKVAATVIWSNALGCGVKFHPNSNRDVQIVDDLIYFVENTRNERRDVLDSIFKKAS